MPPIDDDTSLLTDFMIKRATTIPESFRKPIVSGSVRTAGLLVLSFLAALLNTAPLQAQSIATVQPNPAQLELQQGETAALEIWLENARDLYGIDVRLSFDPALLEIVDVDSNQAGVQMAPGDFPSPDLVALNAADNVTGAARYIVTQLNPTPPATGSGVVFIIRVRALAAGRTELAIPLVEMSDRDGNLLAVNTGSSAIEVRSNPAAATGIPLPPPGGGAPGDPAASATPSATAAPATAPTAEGSAVGETAESPLPAGQPAGGATPIAPEATAVIQAGAGETSAVEAGGSDTGAVETGASETTGDQAEATDTAAVLSETGTTQDEAASSAISAAILSVQAGETQAETTQEQPAAAPQVIGGSSDPSSAAPERELPATESANGRPSPSRGMVLAVIAVLILAGLLLAIARARGRRSTGPSE